MSSGLDKTKPGVCLLLACVFLAIRYVAEAETPPRDLSSYENAGVIYCVTAAGDEANKTARAKLRSFLWDHWNNKKRARVTVKASSVEGMLSTTTYFVEPSAEGSWHVAAINEADVVNFGKTERRKSEYNASELERVSIKARDPASRVIIPNNTRRRPEDYA